MNIIQLMKKDVNSSWSEFIDGKLDYINKKLEELKNNKENTLDILEEKLTEKMINHI